MIVSIDVSIFDFGDSIWEIEGLYGFFRKNISICWFLIIIFIY